MLLDLDLSGSAADLIDGGGGGGGGGGVGVCVSTCTCTAGVPPTNA